MLSNTKRCTCSDDVHRPAQLARETLDYGLPLPPPSRHGGVIPLGRTLSGSPFRLRRVLGRGCTGIVYLADDLSLEREVAIKVLLDGYARQPQVIKGFKREAVAMANVRHENVVQVHAFGEHRGLAYFVMEYLPGGTVATLLQDASQREPLYLDVVLGVVTQVSRGLQALHEQGIIHNDVKPANMLIGPPFRVAIADFGLVQLVDRATPSPELAGTPVYLAPELILGHSIPAAQRHRVDIYALGVTTFELLTGRAPFVCSSISDLFTCHLEDEPPRVSELREDLPLAIDRVLGRAMAKDPAARYDSCEAFLADLNEVRARASRSVSSRGHWMRRRSPRSAASTSTTW